MPRAKNWLTKGGFAREDSDDELGYDDHPWRWIYEDGGDEEQPIQTKESDVVPSSPGSQDGEEDSSMVTITAASVTKKRKASAISTDKKPRIIGARMGSFAVKVGDAVLLKSPEAGKDWAGLICAFSDVDEDGDQDMCAHIMWFCSHEELEASSNVGGKASSGKSRKLPEAMANESYITADFNMNPLTAINGKATVLGKEAFERRYPGFQPPKGKGARSLFAKTIMCRMGVKQRNLRFTQEFEWDEVYKGPEDLLGLLDLVREQTKLRRPKNEDTEFAMDAKTKEDDVEDTTLLATPKKKRKTTSSTVVTPKSSVKSAKFITPTSRRIMIKKPLEITPLGTRILSPAQFNAITASPYSAARTSLHVSAVPASLPCRDNEFATVYQHLHSAITDGSGACIYISGTPGTGKTATVREVVASLHAAVDADELDDFNFVEINGMKVTEPSQSYSLLWEALKGDRVSPSSALTLLEHEFSHPSPRRIPCVVLMDELDQLVTKSQSVMYNFFNWPQLRHSRLIVLAVANTMDLPERTLSNKISSRLGLTRVVFGGYSHSQLMEIIQSRLEDARGIVESDAVQFAARKVAAVSGDARRALDICRRAVEIAEQQAEEASKSTSSGVIPIEEEQDETDEAQTPSKTNRGQKKPKNKQEENPKKKSKQQPHVTIATIKQAINEATTSPIAQHLRSLPLSSKIFLAALLARSRRTGVSESTLGDVLLEAKRIADVAENSAIHDFLLVGQRQQRQDSGSNKRDREIMPRVLAMGAAAMELVEAGIIALDVRGKGERAGKVRLRIGEEEVKGALMGDGDVVGLGFNS